MTPLEIVDAALAEFTTRHAVPADPLIDAIADVDAATSMALADVASRFEDPLADATTIIRRGPSDPGILHARDALDLLLDLRNRIASTDNAPVTQGVS